MRKRQLIAQLNGYLNLFFTVSENIKRGNYLRKNGKTKLCNQIDTNCMRKRQLIAQLNAA